MTALAGELPARCPDALDRRFEGLCFDWDGTAVASRHADGTEARELIEAAVAAGMHVAIVTGTHVGNVDGQLRARADGPGRLLLATNRGSELFEVGRDGPVLIWSRVATDEEERALDDAAARTVAALVARGLHAEVVAQRLNRRKIDLVPTPEWADPPKARIARLLDAVTQRLHDAGLNGLRDVVDLATEASAAAGLTDPRITSDVKHVEIGLTDKSDAAARVAAMFGDTGITGGLVLVAGDEFGPLGGLPGSDAFMLVPALAGAVVVSVGPEPSGVPAGVVHLPGGPDAFASVVRDQLRRRTDGDVPDVDEHTAWCLTIEGIRPQHEASDEAVTTVANGTLGLNGAPVWRHASMSPQVLASGVYDQDGPAGALLAGPLVARVDAELDGRAGYRRVLDMRTGVLREERHGPDGSGAALRFVSVARPGVVGIRVEDHRLGTHAPLPVDPAGMSRGPDAPPGLHFTGTAEHTTRFETGLAPGARWARVDADDHAGGIVVAASDTTAAGRLERIAYYVAGTSAPPPLADALGGLADAHGAGFDRLLAEHRAAWARRWADANVMISGDDALDFAVRLNLFHLMSSVADHDEAAVGARGLSGPGYRGHVFWDADLFALPFFAATRPDAARAMLEYRIRRLPAARDEAVARGRSGARFPWESSRTGREVTPPSCRDERGRLVPIRTGADEEHIVADVAWAACCYADWTGDVAFAEGPGAQLLVETARYWVSRIRRDRHGDAHIYGVIGPDEYHEPVDDDAYTNVMARWNLRRAATLADLDGAERNRFLELADALVDGYDPDTGIYEQFAGFRRLEPLVVADLLARPVCADLELGRDRVSRAQVVKQASVVLAHLVVPDEMAPGSLAPNLAFYEPRTAHGSSLSPGVHAALFARTRQFDDALANLAMAARLDLDDVTGTGGGGVHLATLGSVWQAVAQGFAGLRPTGNALVIDPHLPPAWARLEVPVRFRGTRLRVAVDHEVVTVEADGPALLRLADRHYLADTGVNRFERVRGAYRRR